MILSIFLLITFIPLFHKIKCAQQVRVLGPREHYKKNGTPTMGGVVIIISSLIVYIIYYLKNKKTINIMKVLMIIIPLIAYGVIGFIDDYLKVIKKNNDGLSPKVKFLHIIKSFWDS